MLKIAILVSIFFNYACAGIIFGSLAPAIRQQYAGYGLTEEQIFEHLSKTALDLTNEEVMLSVKKKRSLVETKTMEKKSSEPEMPDVIKTKITTKKPYTYCRGRVFCYDWKQMLKRI